VNGSREGYLHERGRSATAEDPGRTPSKGGVADAVATEERKGDAGARPTTPRERKACVLSTARTKGKKPSVGLRIKMVRGGRGR